MTNSIDRPAFSFFRNLRPSKPRQFALIGLGRFGRAVCETLHQSGYEVLGTDINEKRVADILSAGISAHAVVLDSTNPLLPSRSKNIEEDIIKKEGRKR